MKWYLSRAGSDSSPNRLQFLRRKCPDNRWLTTVYDQKRHDNNSRQENAQHACKLDSNLEYSRSHGEAWLSPAHGLSDTLELIDWQDLVLTFFVACQSETRLDSATGRG